VRLRIDGDFDEITRISTVAIANGQFFGGGMRVAPQAVPDDGLSTWSSSAGLEKPRAGRTCARSTRAIT